MEQADVESETHASTWSDASTRASLRVLAQGAAELAGFGEAAISVRRGNGIEVIATSGLGTSEMIGTQVPIEVLELELTRAEHWGVLRFVPHERVGREVLAYVHLSSAEIKDVPDAWHPVDMLLAPLLDDEGVLRGLLSVDSPADGRRPGSLQRAALSSYAGVARTQVLLALEREELQARVRLSTKAREIVRRALGEDSLDKVMEASREAVVTAFRADGMWLWTLDADGGVTTTWHSELGQDRPPFEELGDLAIGLAPIYWADQYVAHFSRARSTHPGLSPDQVETLVDFLDRIGIGSVLFIPLGVGRQCLGFLVLSRISDTPSWTTTEYEAARDIGYDLGRAIANTRQLEQDRALVERLRELDRYRTELMNTVAHELRNPLASVAGHLELIEEDDDLSDNGRRSVDAAIRGAGRLEAVIEDLLAVARVSDPDAAFEPVPVDLRDIVVAVVDECTHLATAKSIRIASERSPEACVIEGLPDELHRVIANLLSNAVKYSHDDSAVSVELMREGQEIVVTVVDRGLGISKDDQRNLFTEFFRSNNPEALARPGSGLGLVIVNKIVQRHGGRTNLESSLGRGTTVTVRLPAKP